MGDTPPDERAGERFQALVNLIARLRGPGGCPWDREQTHRSLMPMTIEEAYEVVQAIDEGDDSELEGELGDLVLQVIFHAQIAAEEGRFTVADVLDQISAKMVRRHPHVFGGGKASTSGEVLRNWEAVKEEELAARGQAGSADGSMLDSVSRSLPALMEAFQMTTKASRVGFDWPGPTAVLDKLQEEVRELQDAWAAEPPRPEAVAAEVGDLLFVAVNLARVLEVDPESALKASNRKFRRRFRFVEERLRARGRKPADSSLAEMETLWIEAKRQE